MQNGTRKAHRFGKSRVAVQRIAVAGQSIKKSLVGPRVAFRHQIGGARRNLMQLGPALRGTAKAAIAACEDRGDDGEKLVAAHRLAGHPFLYQHRALALALVQNRQHALVGHDIAFGRKRLVKGDAPFAVHHQREIDRGFLRHALAVGRRLAAVDHAGEGGHHFQSVVFIDEGQLLFVQRIAPHPHAQGIEHDVFFVIACGQARGARLHHVVIVDGHLLLSGAALAMSALASI